MDSNVKSQSVPDFSAFLWYKAELVNCLDVITEELMKFPELSKILPDVYLRDLQSKLVNLMVIKSR